MTAAAEPVTPTPSESASLSSELPSGVEASHLARQVATARELAVLDDYIRWETAKASKAADDLIKRLEHLAEHETHDHPDRLPTDPLLDAQLAARSRLMARNEIKDNYALTKTGAVAHLTKNAYKGGGADQTGKSSGYAFSSYVANVDGQSAVDACTGGLTYSKEISAIIGKAYYPIHVSCNGSPILGLKKGDKVHIGDVGDFKVVDSRDVKQGDTTAAIRTLKGSAVLQTCYKNDNRMRVVGIARI
jgi:hypothetical protein